MSERPTRHVVRMADADEARAAVPALAELLMDCVGHGASVSFMAPLGREAAENFWHDVAAGVGRGERLLLLARDGNGRVAGTVQIVFAPQPNQPHRADVAKMLVHSRARGAGMGAALLAAAEAAALAAGRWLLVLDTVPGTAADRLYERAGWTPVGVIPDYALWPDGRPCDTRVFYKRLRAAAS